MPIAGKKENKGPYSPPNKVQKNPRAFPPPPKPKTPPLSLKRGILWTGFFLQKERIFPGVHKIGAAISGPRIADTNFTDTRIFLKSASAPSMAENLHL